MYHEVNWPSFVYDYSYNDISFQAKIKLPSYEIYNVPVDGAYSGGYPFSISGDIRSVPS